ncbi:MAG: glycosyltransferase family 4 protein [Rhizobiaceae bacterium]
MSVPRKIAFFAPIKPPDHPIPSGDRLIARILIKALELPGNEVELASRYICYSKRSSREILTERKQGALEEANKIIADYNSRTKPDRPDIWITYHPYCKAPDWIGPIVSKKLGIPYVTVEAVRTGQGGPEDEWAEWRSEAQAGIKKADMHMVFKPTDGAYLKEFLGSEEKLRNLTPFMDTHTELVTPIQRPEIWSCETPMMITAGMMRKGKKDRNFYILAETLSGLVNEKWNLVVVGGGPEEKNIRGAFSSIPDTRMHWTGQVEHSNVLGWMKSSDLFVWPGWKEPIGMVYLEAQLQGLPVIAYESMGVPLVVEHGKTGFLAPENGIEEMRENIRLLLANKKMRTEMGEAAVKKVSDEHSIEVAAKRLNKLLEELS